MLQPNGRTAVIFTIRQLPDLLALKPVQVIFVSAHYGDE
jgi:hypothetical protein